MTCRFELEFKGESYPRGCPNCSISGSISGACQRGYKQVKLSPEQHQRLGFGYVLLNPEGIPEKVKADTWNKLGTGIPSQVLQAQCKVDDEAVIAPKVPEGLKPFLEVKRYPSKDKPYGIQSKMTRVKRAKLMDYLEHRFNLVAEDKVLDETINEIIAIIEED